MIPPSLRNKAFMQLCWVVPDLERAITDWVRLSGAGPFFVFEDVHFTDSNYRGTPADVAPHRAAIGQMGDMQIELVQPTGDGPGIWTDIAPAGAPGGTAVLHHVGLYCSDYAADRAAYTADGAEVAFEGLMMGARTCYIDTRATLGFFVELITANPVAEQVFGAFRAAAQDWDGRNPVRTLA